MLASPYTNRIFMLVQQKTKVGNTGKFEYFIMEIYNALHSILQHSSHLCLVQKRLLIHQRALYTASR